MGEISGAVRRGFVKPKWPSGGLEWESYSGQPDSVILCLSLCLSRLYICARENGWEKNLGFNLSPAGVTLPSGKCQVVNEVLQPYVPSSPPRTVAFLKGHTGQAQERGLCGRHMPQHGCTCVYVSVYVYDCVCLFVCVHVCTGSSRLCGYMYVHVCVYT